jgi:murein L,D-transpeptidase YcbB/YkuD
VKVSATTPEKDVLILKLKAYNLIPDSLSDDSVSSVDLRIALKNFQRMMNADTTGKADAVTAIVLNFSLSKRAGQIKESLNYWRWTGRLKEKEFILVNIPAARLQIVREDSTKDVSMKVIVGKTATKTPQFTAYISKVITYPYWTVPISIATKEMLPKIRRRISYLEDNNLQVINSKGIEVDPKTVGWERFSEKYFPYTLRQSTGCDNSLGVLKFDLNSPYSIYLHDTNNRNLFGKKERFLSHGCVRLEKPMVLAEYVLREGLDTSSVSKLNACMKEQQPKDFILKKRFPVLIFYMTTDVDENGNLKFYNDVYADEKKKPA